MVLGWREQLALDTMVVTIFEANLVMYDPL